jgi:molecular chaperone DnaK (HSP70)
MPSSKGVLSHRFQPDLIVGIDFGMTCTAVVYARVEQEQSNFPEIKLIKNWPGLRDQIVEKVPTEIIYTPDGKSVQSWGAECRRDTEGWHRCKRWFKLHVPDQSSDQSLPEDDGESTTTLNDHHDGESARRYFSDYLTKLCAYVESKLQAQVVGYKALNVEYAFTVPTSWSNDQSTFESISAILRKVVGVTRNKRARIGLTEAAAAGSESGRDSNKKGDVVLVIDTGGGESCVAIYVD